MKNETIVSIVMPLYNCEGFLVETINSVINQTYKDWELLIIDDCSTDGSLKIAKEYEKKDKRIKSFSLKRNSGAAAARNKGIKEAKGDYLAFIDSDDLWLSKKLEMQLSFMQKESINFCYTYYYTWEMDNRKKLITSKDKVEYKDMLKKNYIGNSTVILNIKKIGKHFVPNIEKRNDYALWLKILKLSDINAICLKEPLGIYRIRNNSISRNKIKLIKYHYKLFREIEGYNCFKSSIYTFYNIYSKLFEKRYISEIKEEQNRGEEINI